MISLMFITMLGKPQINSNLSVKYTNFLQIMD